MNETPAGRTLELATAILLGLISVITALGALQATLWNAEANRLSSDAADARDQGIAVSVASQLQQRSDMRSILTAAFVAMDLDEAREGGDQLEILRLESSLINELADVRDLPDGAFEAWHAAGFPDDGNPVESLTYLVEQGRGDSEALQITSLQLSALSEHFASRAGTFTQAALVHALALFLLGVAGINRLRTARFVTLGVGTAVVIFGLFLMSTAY